MNVNQVYELMQTIVAKNIQDGYLSPDNFYNYINQSQRGYLDYLKGEYQKYQLQRPIAPVSFGQNEMIRQSLAPLIYGRILNPTAGIAPFPNDFEYTDAMWGVYGHYNIRFVQQDRLDSYIHSDIDPIEENPVFVLQEEGFHFFPEDITATRMSYIRTPPSIVWGYVYDSNGIPVWNPATSQDPIWAESDIFQIVSRALAMFGVQVSAPMISQFANDITKGGQ